MEHEEREQLIDWLCDRLGACCWDEYSDTELLEMKRAEENT